MMTDQNSAQTRMNERYRQFMDPLLAHAERDVRLARADGDAQAAARAQARLATLQAALAIYAAAHLHGHGERPWPRERP